MKAVILAGGFAKRLREDLPLDLANMPKPLLPVARRPIIEYILELINPIKDIDSVYILTNKKFEADFRSWLENFYFKKEIKLTIEPIIDEAQDTGAVGGLGFFIGKERISDDLLVIAGDNLFTGLNLADFVKSVREKNATIVACYDMEDKEKVKRKYGVVALNKDKKIVDLEEKPECPKSSLVSTACYLFPSHVLKLVFDYLADKTNPTDAPGYFIRWLAQQTPMYGFVFRGKWFDIGSLEVYEEANQFMKEKLRREE